MANCGIAGSSGSRPDEDDEHLLDIRNSQIRSQPGVYLAETLVYLKTLKQQYNWGTR
jgi:Lrp/AsnC family transcriptional regulator, regulator for asnA, asnC and gidA